MGELVSDRHTVKVEKMFQMNLVCVVTDLISLSDNSSLSLHSQVDFKTSICNKATIVNGIIK